jgi:hypothetical protein
MRQRGTGLSNRSYEYNVTRFLFTAPVCPSCFKHLQVHSSTFQVGVSRHQLSNIFTIVIFYTRIQLHFLSVRFVS